MTEHHQVSPRGPRVFEARRVRQGEVILKRRWQRTVFLAGLAAAVLVALVAALALR